MSEATTGSSGSFTEELRKVAFENPNEKLVRWSLMAASSMEHKDATIEDLSRKLEEARGRINTLESQCTMFQEISDAREFELKQAEAKIAALTIEADRHVEEITNLRNDDCFDDDENFSLSPTPLERKTIGVVVPEEELAAKDARIAELEALCQSQGVADGNRISRLEAALTPFARLADIETGRDDDIFYARHGDPDRTVKLTYGDLRTARTVLEGKSNA